MNAARLISTVALLATALCLAQLVAFKAAESEALEIANAAARQLVFTEISPERLDTTIMQLDSDYSQFSLQSWNLEQQAGDGRSTISVVGTSRSLIGIELRVSATSVGVRHD